MGELFHQMNKFRKKEELTSIIQPDQCRLSLESREPELVDFHLTLNAENTRISQRILKECLLTQLAKRGCL